METPDNPMNPEQSVPRHPDGDEQFVLRWDAHLHKWVRHYFQGNSLSLDRHRGGSDPETCFVCSMALKPPFYRAELECMKCWPAHSIEIVVCRAAEVKTGLDRLRFMHALVLSRRINDGAGKRPRPTPPPEDQDPPDGPQDPSDPQPRLPLP
jgi:hypothetical protein